MARLWNNPKELSFKAVEKLVYHTVHAFQRKHGGNFDDLLSTAQELYLKAYRTYSYDKGEFSQRVRFVIWYGLLDEFRKGTEERTARKELDWKTVPGKG